MHAYKLMSCNSHPCLRVCDSSCRSGNCVNTILEPTVVHTLPLGTLPSDPHHAYSLPVDAALASLFSGYLILFLTSHPIIMIQGGYNASIPVTVPVTD